MVENLIDEQLQRELGFGEQVQREPAIDKRIQRDSSASTLKDDGSIDMLSLITYAMGTDQATDEILSTLPEASDVASMYGEEPKIIGLETCATFQNTVPAPDRYMGPAGLFNTVRLHQLTPRNANSD